jgi:hypothetical protein
MMSFVASVVLLLADPSAGSGTRALFATTIPAAPKPAAPKVPARVIEFFAMMKGLASREAALPASTRIVPEDPKADQAKLLNHVGVEGIEFIDFTKEDPSIRRVTRAELGAQIKVRRGEQLLWLMEIAYFLKWWRATPASVEHPDKTTLVVTFPDRYILTFKDQPDRLLLVKAQDLDPGGD